MKKYKNLKNLKLSKKSISNLNQNLVVGGHASSGPTTSVFGTCYSCPKGCGDWDR